MERRSRVSVSESAGVIVLEKGEVVEIDVVDHEAKGY
jgi:hypothetical protein